MVRFTLNRSLRDGFLLQRRSDERRDRIAALLFRADRFDDVLRALEIGHQRIGRLLLPDLRNLRLRRRAAAEQPCVEVRRLLRRQIGVERPVFLLHERADFALALHNHPHAQPSARGPRKARAAPYPRAAGEIL